MDMIPGPSSRPIARSGSNSGAGPFTPPSMSNPEPSGSAPSYHNRQGQGMPTTSSHTYPSSGAPPSPASSAASGPQSSSSHPQSHAHALHASHASASTSKAAPPPKVSCMECRNSKVKCLPSSEDAAPDGSPQKCARCTRLDKACVFEKHKRGRKPDAVKYGRLEKQLETILLELRSERSTRTARDDGRDDDDESPASKRLRRETAELLSNWGAASNASVSPTSKAASLSRALLSRESVASPPPRSGTAAPYHRTPASDSDRDRDRSRDRDRDRDRGEGEDNMPDGGLPSLSNPLKLLAQASAAGEEEDEEHAANGQASSGSAGRMSGRRRSRTLATGHIASTGFDGSGKPPNRLEIYDAKHDVGPKLDPITSGLISLDQARYLWSIFLDKLSHPLMLMDPILYTFDYIRPRSAMMLSVGLALTARFIPRTPDMKTDEIADNIEKHVLEVCIPSILLDGLRSIHIAKALMLLAAYNGHSIPLSDDRSFNYVSWAFSMCVELDLNRRMVSLQADQRDEVLQRKLRERERSYLTAWAYSFSIALHHGRRCSLSIHDPLVASAREWHHSPYALPEDAGLVSNLQLRQLIARNLDYFMQHVAPSMPKTAADGSPDQACRLLLEFHRRSITEDLDAWHATWVMPIANGALDPSARPFRLRSTAFYHAYATLILHSLPLKHGRETEPCLKPYSEQAHRAAVSVIALFLRLPKEYLIWGTNSVYVTTGFAAVYVLRAPDTGYQVVEMIQQVIETMEEAGNVTPHRKGFAAEYAAFLRKVVRLHGMRSVKAEAATASASAMHSRNASLRASPSAEGMAGVEQGGQGHAAVAFPMDSSSMAAVDGRASQQQHAQQPAHHTQGLQFPHPYDQQPHPQPQQQPQQQQHQGQGQGQEHRHLYAPSGHLGSCALPSSSSSSSNLLTSLGNGNGNTNGNGNGNGPTAQQEPSSGGGLSSAPGTGTGAGAGAGGGLDVFDLPNATGQSPAALMDTLMMNHPIGLHFNSLLGPDTDWGSDWSFFLPGGDESGGGGGGGNVNGSGSGQGQGQG